MSATFPYLLLGTKLFTLRAIKEIPKQALGEHQREEGINLTQVELSPQPELERLK